MAKHYPANWRIDDWDDPWLPLPLRLFNYLPDSLIRPFTKLDEKVLLEYAQKHTGLKDFGGDTFLEPFRVLLNDLNSVGHMTPVGRITARTVLRQSLIARLYIEDRLAHDKTIVEQQVRQPVFIAGLPRTGTTHLHNLLSQISALRYLPLWQTLDPVMPYGASRDHRRQFSDMAVRFSRLVVPLFQRMHEMETDMPHEELTLTGICFSSFYFEGLFQAPGYRQWYASHDQQEGYDYLKTILRILQSEPPPVKKQQDPRWILKSPQHLDQLETILQVFPDASILLTHRDPVQAVLSMVSMMIYTSRSVYRQGRRKEEAKAWVDRLEQMLRSSMEQVERLPKDRIYNVKFTEFMADQKGTVEKIADFIGVELDADSHRAIDAHLQSHVRDRHGRIDYNFEDLGLNKDEIVERFSFYTGHL